MGRARKVTDKEFLKSNQRTLIWGEWRKASPTRAELAETCRVDRQVGRRECICADGMVPRPQRRKGREERRRDWGEIDEGKWFTLLMVLGGKVWGPCLAEPLRGTEDHWARDRKPLGWSPHLQPPGSNGGFILTTLPNCSHLPEGPALNSRVGLSFCFLCISKWGLNLNRLKP